MADGGPDGDDPSPAHPEEDGRADAGTAGGDSRADGTTAEGDDESLPGGARTTDEGRREVVVPDRLYRTVAVFSTLVAIVSVVLGFWFLSAAGSVLQNPTASAFVGLVRAVGGLSMAEVEPYLPVVALAFGLVGLVLIAGGGWVFAMGSRFRTGEMGKPKDEADERTGDG